MAATDEARRIAAVGRIALRLASSAPSGRILLAKLAQRLEPVWLPLPGGARLWGQLEAAEAAVEPVPFGAIEAALREAWGAPPREELDELEREPVAVTPTAQIHRGAIDGKPVAIKVIRPGLQAAVRQDLALLEGLVAPLSSAFPRLDAAALLREARERILDELDLEQEAQMQRRFARALRSDPELLIAPAFTQLSHPAVCVSGWVDGTPVELSGEETPGDWVAPRLVRFVVGGLRAGLVHADLRAQDLRRCPDGRLAILDFGASASVDPARAELALALVQAFAAGDGEALGEALERLGMLGAERGPAALALASHALGELGAPLPSRLDVDATLAVMRRAGELPQELSELVSAGGLHPGDLWPARAIATMFGTIARLGASAEWPELLRTSLREGWERP
jgi:hypothetical protein